MISRILVVYGNLCSAMSTHPFSVASVPCHQI